MARNSQPGAHPGALLIMPVQSDLAHMPQEAQEIVSNLSAAGYTVRLIQKARRIDLYTAINQSGSVFDLVWLAGHSVSDEGFLLSDGETLSVAQLCQILLSVRAQSLILNVCFSAAMVMAIQSFVAVDVVATIDPAGIQDEEALLSGVLLSKAIRENHGDLSMAAVVGSSGQYRYFPARERMESVAGVTDRDGLDMGRLADQMERLVRVIQGEPGIYPGLIDQLAQLRAQIENYTRTDAEWKRLTERRVDNLETTVARFGTVSVSQRHITLITIAMILAIVGSVALAVWLSGGVRV